MDFDRRGYPIPYIVMRRSDGTPDFVINDIRKVMECLEKGLCAISGLPLEDDVWFVGGNLAAYHPAGAFKDPPVRKACADYAMQVCPFLAAPSYTGMKDAALDRLQAAVEAEGAHMAIDEHVIPGKPDFFVVAKCNGYVAAATGDVMLGEIALHPNRPWIEAQHWKDGECFARLDRGEVAREMHALMVSAIGEGLRAENLPPFKHALNQGKGVGLFPWTMKQRRG